jgi:hypothetical protein
MCVLRLMARVRFLGGVVLKGIECLYGLQGTKTYDNVNLNDLELMT